MQLTQPFNPMMHDPTQTGGGGLPVGKHPVVIKAAEIKPTSAGDGGLIEFTLEIIDGPARGATGAYRLNLYNKSEKAARIAASQLSALCHVTQQFQLGADGTQLSVLFNIPFVVEVTPQKSDPAYTEVHKVYDMAGNEPGKAPTNTGSAAGFTGQQQGQQTQQGQQGGAGAWAAGQGQQTQQPNAGQQGGGWGGGQQTQPQGQQSTQAGQQGGQAGGWGGGNGQGQQGGAQGQQQQQGNGGGWQQGAGQTGAGNPAWGPQR